LDLAQEIATNLKVQLAKCKVGRFADGEVNMEIETNVRGKDVYII